ncbi:MAG: hypothetical protein R3Y63_09055 [Eubacteriales bacterium]
MDYTSILLAIALFFVGILFLVILLRMPKNQAQEKKAINTYEVQEENKEERHHVECSKVIIYCLLAIWGIGALVGLWVVVFRDVSVLDMVQNYISTTANVGVVAYTGKAGVENWKKMSNTQTMTKKEERTHNDESS